MSPHCCPPGRPGDPTAVSPSTPPPEGNGQGDRDSAIPLPGGTFLMGSEDADTNPGDGEGPVRDVAVGPFAIDAHCVTNQRFTAFVEATGYRTEAERFGWSYVFATFLSGEPRRVSPRPKSTPWWCGVQGAYWAAPEGPGSDLSGRSDHPVVHVSWTDANAFCHWEGSRLPTEAEWEYAARGGLEGKRFPWGDELTPGGEHRCNIWQGRFPSHNTTEDGYAGTAPVTAYRPNGYGLHNVAGNVWEWCADWWTTAPSRAEGPRANPTGPGNGTTRVLRGGSYLCHDSYCNRYRVAARTSNTPDSSSGNTGFRVAWNTTPGA
ncbi:formylglycine-generating enzyme family protein [Streptomyces sp. NPDC019937]|uniref:formylglycine-generating enzyme family protein n=1 Tax=Streptomyces sp. NPDC019937 TaxID=3154787 RepID=UPI0033C54104